MKRVARIVATVILFLFCFLLGVSARSQEKPPEIKPDLYTKLLHAQALAFQAKASLVEITMELQQQYQQRSQPWVQQSTDATKEWNEAKSEALKAAKLDPDAWDVENSLAPKFVKKAKPEAAPKPADPPKPVPKPEEKKP